MNSYFQFITELRGYDFYNKKTGQQVYRWELFWSGITPIQAFRMFNTTKKI